MNAKAKLMILNTYRRISYVDSIIDITSATPASS